MDLKNFKKELLKHEKFNSIYKDDDLMFEISEMIEEERIKQGLTQKQLAELADTKQPAIARIESGRQSPRVVFLEKIAKAFNLKLEIKFISKEEYRKTPDQVVNIFLGDAYEYVNGLNYDIEERLGQEFSAMNKGLATAV